MGRRMLWLTAIWTVFLGCDGRGPVPPADFGTPEAVARGRELSVEHCALCHGGRADGRGRRRAALSGPPADFTDPSWHWRTTPERAFRIVREGKPGTSMPAWAILSDGEIWDLVSYLRAVSRGTARPAA